jgi:hypothetical protein
MFGGGGESGVVLDARRRLGFLRAGDAADPSFS